MFCFFVCFFREKPWHNFATWRSLKVKPGHLSQFQGLSIRWGTRWFAGRGVGGASVQAADSLSVTRQGRRSHLTLKETGSEFWSYVGWKMLRRNVSLKHWDALLFVFIIVFLLPVFPFFFKVIFLHFLVSIWLSI